VFLSILGRGTKEGGVVVGEHVWGKTGFRVRDVLGYCSYEEGIGPYCYVMRQGGGLFQQEALDPCAGRTGEDCVLEGLWSSAAPWTGWVRVLVEPRGVGGQVAFC